MLPIENSTEGIVTDIYDLLTEYQLYIVGEQGESTACAPGTSGSFCGDSIPSIPIHRHLHSVSITSKNIRHGKPSRQKTQLLQPRGSKGRAEEKPGGDRKPCRQASSTDFLSLPENICHNDQNVTRFIIVSKVNRSMRKMQERSAYASNCRMQAVLCITCLSHFIYNSLSMTKIESRPIPGQNWKYRFFVDFEGNLEDPAVKNALRGLEAEAIGVRVLGKLRTAGGRYKNDQSKRMRIIQRI